MKKATAHALDGQQFKASRSPEQRYKKSLGQYKNYTEIFVYLVVGEEYCKFGLAYSQSRIDQKLEQLSTKEFYKYLLPRDLACRIEADLILIGEDLGDTFSGSRSGMSEFRHSKYKSEIINYILDAIQ